MCRMHPADELAQALDVPQEQILAQQQARLAPEIPLSESEQRDAATEALRRDFRSRMDAKAFEAIKTVFGSLTAEQRKEVVEGYCRDCFRPLSEIPGGVCHCEDDE